MDQTLTLAAGVAVEFQELADFFRIIGAPTTDISLIFYKAGAEQSRATNVGPGYAEEFSKGFDKVRILSTAGGDVHFVSRLGNRVRYDAPPTGNVMVANLPAAEGAYSRGAIAAQDNVTASVLFAANAARRILAIQNNDNAKFLRVRVDGTAPTTTAGLRIAPNGYWEAPAGFAPSGAVQVIAETAGGIAVEAVEG